MIVYFEKDYLKELYVQGQAKDKHHRYQPEIVKKFAKVINIMKFEQNVDGLKRYGSLHYERLSGDREGVSSVRVNDKYRIEFTESVTGDSIIANICNIIELSNHYKS